MTSAAGAVIGVDEAGRGPVLGPLVVAAVRADPDELARLGVADSKELAPGRREELAEGIRGRAEAVAVEVVPPGTVDEAVRGDGLDGLEARAFARAAEAAGPGPVVADAVGPDPEAFARDLEARLPGEAPVEAAHGADGTEPPASAASIVAKVVRDREVAALAEEVGADVGSGYPSDPATRAFLEDWVEDRGELPPGTRTSWSTAEELVRPEPGLDAFAEESP